MIQNYLGGESQWGTLLIRIARERVCGGLS